MVISFGLNQASSALNASRSWSYTKKAMALQDMYNRAYTRDSYGLMREGLQKAGYNPLLALGTSANSANYSPTTFNADSDSGAQAVENTMSAVNTASNVKLNNANSAVATEQKKLIEEQKRHQELENKKLEAENATSPKVMISDLIGGKSNKTVSALGQGYGKIKSVANKVGIDLPDLPPLPDNLENESNSAKKSIKNNKNKGIVKLYDTRFGKPVTYSKGVPRNVVNKFKKLERM